MDKFDINNLDNTTKAEIAESAAELLETQGHIKGYYHNSNGYCLFGAGRQIFWRSCDNLMRNLEKMNPAVADILRFNRPEEIFAMNDSNTFTKEDAIKTAMDAAKFWRNQ